MKKLLIVIVILAVVGAGGGWLWINQKEIFDPSSALRKALTRSLEKYDFDELKKRGGVASPITIVGPATEIEKKRADFAKARMTMDLPAKKYEINSQIFSYQSDGKKITGLLNIPLTPLSNKMPAIILIRGYADKPGYYIGSGNWRVADELTYQGLVTVTLDFLGYGGSDEEDTDMLAARFVKVAQVMDLIASVKQLAVVDPNRIGLWAHSNGGQIVLSTLETTGGNYPTVLWAPMTNPFPQSVLDTADGLDDGGAAVKKAIGDFEKYYDARRYAFENYYQWVAGPVLIMQGTNDEWCKVEWQQTVVNGLKAKGKEASLQVYEGDDHNLSKNWDKAVGESLSFFFKFFGN